MRRILYISGTRADFGLMQSTLALMEADPRIDLEVCVTGMHLNRHFGHTIDEITASGLRIACEVPVPLGQGTGAEMALATAETLRGLTSAFQAEQPDLVLVLGDRGEMLAGALAAIYMNIHVAHLHGGEVTGTVDEMIRHAISRFAHYHLTSTEGARTRLIKMGEAPERILTAGAPGLDGLFNAPDKDRAALCASAGFDPMRPIGLLVYHPVVQSADHAGEEMAGILKGLQDTDIQILALKPNADAGYHGIADALVSRDDLRVETHLDRPTFLSWVTAADVMLGNSSSGIIEAASFGTPVINIGDRQAGRERNANTVDIEPNAPDVKNAVRAALAHGRFPAENIYGDGYAGDRIVEFLAEQPLDPAHLKKALTY